MYFIHHTGPRKHASNNVQSAAPKLGHLKNNSGELILRFDSSVGNESVLSELNARKDEIKKVLKGFELDLTSIKKGSVVIKFHLQHGSKTFDTLTLDGEIDKLADQLLSNESFGRFRRETPTLSIQFIVKGNLQHATGNAQCLNLCGTLLRMFLYLLLTTLQLCPLYEQNIDSIPAGSQRTKGEKKSN